MQNIIEQIKNGGDVEMNMVQICEANQTAYSGAETRLLSDFLVGGRDDILNRVDALANIVSNNDGPVGHRPMMHLRMGWLEARMPRGMKLTGKFGGAIQVIKRENGMKMRISRTNAMVAYECLMSLAAERIATEDTGVFSQH